MHDLAHYGLSAGHGFLSPYEVDAVLLPAEFAAIEDAAAMLPDYLASGRVRHWLGRLPQIDCAVLTDAGDAPALRTAMLRFAFLAQAWVWGEADPVDRLPAPLAVPLAALADALGVPPIMTYQHYVLDNWYRLDKAGAIALGNLAIDQHFAGGTDESGFILVHVAIEARAGAALASATGAVAAAAAGDDAALLTALGGLLGAIETMNAGLDPMASACDPHVYYHRVRPYMFGWPGAGLIYEGVERLAGRPVALRGQTGSQSGIVPALDAALGVPHPASGLGAFLTEIHGYRAPAHRAFIDDLQGSTVRAAAAAGGGALRDAYNGCLEQLARFRHRHLELAARYIAVPAAAAGKDGGTGTGGTPFLTYLAQHRDDSRAAFL